MKVNGTDDLKVFSVAAAIVGGFLVLVAGFVLLFVAVPLVVK